MGVSNRSEMTVPIDDGTLPYGYDLAIVVLSMPDSPPDGEQYRNDTRQNCTPLGYPDAARCEQRPNQHEADGDEGPERSVLRAHVHSGLTASTRMATATRMMAQSDMDC